MLESVNLTYQMHLSTVKGTFWTRKEAEFFRKELDQLRGKLRFFHCSREIPAPLTNYVLNLFLVS